jgi:hypothetical protein
MASSASDGQKSFMNHNRVWPLARTATANRRLCRVRLWHIAGHLSVFERWNIANGELLTAFRTAVHLICVAFCA